MSKTGVSRFFGVTSREAMRQVRLALGPEALIISNRRVNGGVEVIAADPGAADSLAPQSAAPAVTAEQSVSVQLEQQMSSLRAQLSSQMETLLWGDSLREHIPVFTAYQRLIAMGYSASLARQLLTQLPRDLDESAAWRWVQQELAARLPVMSATEACLNPGATIALVGPTGVGKTTTLAKLTYHCVQRYGAQRVALISTDNYRVGAHEQLKIYAKLLKVPIHIVQTEAEFRQAVLAYGPETTLLIDSVGVSQRDDFVRAQASLLASSARAVQRFLVVSAASSSETLDEVGRAYKTDGGRPLKGCIVTKLDEATIYGPVVDMALRYQLPIAFITHGQKVPEDLILPDDNRIRKTLLSPQSEGLPGNSSFKPTVAELATLVRHPRALDPQPGAEAQRANLAQQQAIVELASASQAGAHIDNEQLDAAVAALHEQPEWRFWTQAGAAASKAMLPQLWASIVQQLPFEDQRVFFFHDHLKAPQSWHPNAQLVVSNAWTADQLWRGPLLVQQISAQQHHAFPSLKAEAGAPAEVFDPMLAAARSLPQNTALSRWHYHVFSDYQPSRFLQWLAAGYEVCCVVPGATRCRDLQAHTTVAACIKQAGKQPLYLNASVHALLQGFYGGQAIEINYAQTEVFLAVRGQPAERVRLYGLEVYAADDGKLLEQCYAFSSVHARAHTQSVLQALLVFVLQRPLKRLIQYQLEAAEASGGPATEKGSWPVYVQALGGVLAWRLLHDPQWAPVKQLVIGLWGQEALRPGRLARTLKRLANFMQVLGHDGPVAPI